MNVPVFVGGESWFGISDLHDSQWVLKGIDFVGNMIFSDDGSIIGSVTDDLGDSANLAGTEFEFFANGGLRFDDFPPELNFDEGFGSLSNTGDFIAFNPQLPVVNSSNAQLGLLVNNSNNNFNNSFMAGTWDMAGANMRGTITFNANGQITGGSFRTGEGENGNITGGTYTINALGDVTFSVNTNTDTVPNVRTGAINNSGDLIIINNPDMASGGDPDLVMLVKRSGTYSNANMRGMWGFHGQFGQGFLAFDGAGRITGGEVTAEEGFQVVGITGTYSVGSNGSFTLNATSARRSDTNQVMPAISWSGALNKSKNVAAANNTRLPLDPDSYEADMIVLVDTANRVPTMTTLGTFTGAVEQTPFVISFNDLLTRSNATDEVPGALGFVITSLGNGTLEIDGNPAQVGDVIESGDDVTWTPATGANGTITAFSVKATDGLLESTTALPVRVTTTLKPRVSVSKTKDATETNGQTTGKGTFTFTRTGATTTPLTVHYIIIPTATVGVDYNDTLTGQVVIPTGKTSVTLDVLVIDDTLAEPAETVMVSLVHNDSYTLDANVTKRTATVTITDNEPLVSVTATDNSATESSVATTARATYTIARTGPITQPLTVKFDLGGNATLTDDYAITAVQNSVVTHLTDTVVIPAGAASIVLTVQAVDDALIEGTETLILTLQAEDTYTPAPGKGQANVTIVDNEKDTVSVVASVNSAAESANPTATCGLFIIERTTPGNDPLTVNFTIPTGTGRATRGTDYTLRLGLATGPIITANSVTIAAGQTQAQVFVVPVDDALAEPSETVTLNLAAATAYNLDTDVVNRTAMVTIADNEPVVSIEATDDEASETDPANNGKGTFTISRSSSAGPLTVNFTVVTGTGQATRTTDYILRKAGTTTPITANSISFANGETEFVLEVIPVDDTLAEPSETVTLNLSNATTYTPDGNARSATVTIEDNEPVVRIEAVDDEGDTDAHASESGETGRFRFRRVGNTNGSMTVNFTVASGTGHATRGSDYNLRLGSASGTIVTASNVVFANGDEFVYLFVVPVNDAIAETSETVTINLSNATTYTPDGNARSATVTIEDNEPKVGIVASDDTATEQGTTPGEYTITRESSDNSNALTVNFNVATGTGRATRGSDYVLRLNEVGGTLVTANAVTIPAGQTSVKLVLVPVDDALTEVTEAAVLTLTPTTAYSVKNGEGSATVNIVDNEPVVSITKTKDASEASPTTTGRGTFTISRTGATTSALTVNYSVTGTATPGTGGAGDYTTLSGSVVIAAGQASVVINVTPNSDADIEGTETVIVTLTPNDNYRLGSSNTSASMNVADGPVAAQGLFGTITFNQTTYNDLRTNVPFAGLVGQITSTGTFTSTNGRNGGYTYTTVYGPGQSAFASLQLFFNGQPTLNANPLTLTWTATRVDSLHNRQIQWPTSASGSSGSFDGNGSVLVGSTLIDVDGFFKLI